MKNFLKLKHGVYILAVALVGFSSVTPLFATAGIGSRPANPDPDNPRTQSIFIYTLEKGTNKSDQLKLENGSEEDATVEVYAVDSVVTATGDMTCKQKSEEKISAGKWVSMAQNEVMLKAKSTTLVDFSVAVPDNVDDGEHNACIVVQRKNDASNNDTQGGVQLQTRQAVRMAIVVPGDIHRVVDIDSFNIEHKDGKQLYNISVKNTGNVSADVDIRLVVKDSFGKVVYENGGVNATMANEVRQFRYESALKPFWGGKYKAELSISYNKKAGTFDVSENGDEVDMKKAQPVNMFFWPSIEAIAIIIGALVALGLTVRYIYVKLRRRKAALGRGRGGSGLSL